MDGNKEINFGLIDRMKNEEENDRNEIEWEVERNKIKLERKTQERVTIFRKNLINKEKEKNKKNNNYRKRQTNCNQ